MSCSHATTPPSGSRRRDYSVDEYYQGVREQNRTVLARVLTLVESQSAPHQILAEQLLTRLMPHTGGSARVGITGAPGAGKSTFIDALGVYLIGRGHHVAVLTIDPSSGVSGGSILGDKTRMSRLSAESNAYIRSSPSAGTLGGVARTTRESILVCEAAGFDVVLVETVGVGQSETTVAEITDCILTLLLPGAGDELQGIKRGLLERVDVLAVNKADGENRAAAEVAARQYNSALKFLAGRDAHDAPTVLTCSARQHHGIDAVWETISRRLERMRENGQLAHRRRQQNLRALWAMVEAGILKSVRCHTAVNALRRDLEKEVLRDNLPPEVAARRILELLGIKEGERDVQDRRPSAAAAADRPSRG